MAASTIVMILDLDDPKRGEINVVNEAAEAERMVESLLQSGFAQDRIRVFSATGLELKIVHRPVVTFVESNGQTVGDGDTPLVHNGASV